MKFTAPFIFLAISLFLFACEKDDDLALLLKEKFDNEINIINDDVLNIDASKICNEKFTVFGNLPYNISTEILSKWIIRLNNEFAHWAKSFCELG